MYPRIKMKEENKARLRLVIALWLAVYAFAKFFRMDTAFTLFDVVWFAVMLVLLSVLGYVARNEKDGYL